jgi:UDP-2,3-diacylglucosamine pyrophosphatase LpxH
MRNNKANISLAWNSAETCTSAPSFIEYDVIIISDVHLGSKMCQARELDEFLSRIRVKYLILAGDVFDDLKFNRLQHWHWQVLSRIRKISDHCQVVWIRGNHDVVSAPTMSHLLGVEVKNHFTWSAGENRFYVVHGDRWDAFIYKHQNLTAIVTSLYNALQRFHSQGMRSFTRWLKKRAKLLTRNSEAVRFGAVEFAKKHGLDAIFCGHTHMAMLTESDGIIYGNDGTWQSDDPHFIGIDQERVHLCKYSNSRVQVISTQKLKRSKITFYDNPESTVPLYWQLRAESDGGRPVTVQRRWLFPVL